MSVHYSVLKGFFGLLIVLVNRLNAEADKTQMIGIVKRICGIPSVIFGIDRLTVVGDLVFGAVTWPSYVVDI